MKRQILVYASLFVAIAALGAQEASQPNAYQGVSTPPPDDTITATNPVEPAQPKPAAGRPASPTEPSIVRPVQPAAQPPVRQQTSPVVSGARVADPDGDMVLVPNAASASDPMQPVLKKRSADIDPDGDIVHPRALAPGELGEGATIRVRLLDRLSSVESEKGEKFRSQVASDVLQNGEVLIPAGAEIDGRLVEVSSGHVGGTGSMRLRPETVILANGSRYSLHAEITGTPGSRTRVGAEGTILPDSRLKRDGVEYGGAVGAGATTGAVMGGPVGALAGGLVGAGLVTAHLLVDHPQATLEPGTVLLFTLTEPLQMSPVAVSGN